MISIRTIRREDVKAVSRLAAEVGFPNRSAEGWHWALFGNPDQSDIPPGLVAERKGHIVSMIGLQARHFLVHGKPANAVCGHTFISGPDGRGAGFALSRRALQSFGGGIAIYTLNNNELAGDFHKRIGLTAWLGRAGRKRIEWPVHSVTMAAGHALTRLTRNEDVHDWLSKRELFARAPRNLTPFLPKGGSVMTLDPNDTDDAWLIEDFSAAASLGRRAVPARSARTYAYQMADPDAPGRIALLGLKDGDSLNGLIQLAITKPNAFEPAHLEVIDMEVRPDTDSALIVPVLVRAAKSVARRARLSRLRLPFSARFDEACYVGTGLRFTRTANYDPAHAAFGEGAEALEEYWQPSGYEGDMFFALRNPPASTRAKIRPTAKEKLHGSAWKHQAP